MTTALRSTAEQLQDEVDRIAAYYAGYCEYCHHGPCICGEDTSNDND